MHATWRDARWFRIISLTYLGLLGVVILFLAAVWPPSFWCIPCAVLFASSLFLWSKPSRGASTSLPFLLAFLLPIISLALHKQISRTSTITDVFLLALAIGLCVVILSARGISWRWLLLSVVLMAASFSVDRLFTNQDHITTLTMQYSLNGNTPWSYDVQRDAHNDPPVLVYVPVSGGYCYDAVFYQPLKDRLLREHPATVTVQYNRFFDFGKERSYNLRSIDGIKFNDSTHTLIDEGDGYGGTTLAADNASASPTCPR